MFEIYPFQVILIFFSYLCLTPALSPLWPAAVDRTLLLDERSFKFTIEVRIIDFQRRPTYLRKNTIWNRSPINISFEGMKKSEHIWNGVKHGSYFDISFYREYVMKERSWECLCCSCCGWLSDYVTVIMFRYMVTSKDRKYYEWDINYRVHILLHVIEYLYVQKLFI